MRPTEHSFRKALPDVCVVCGVVVCVCCVWCACGVCGVFVCAFGVFVVCGVRVLCVWCVCLCL